MNSTSSRRERIAVTAIKPAKKPAKEKGRIQLLTVYQRHTDRNPDCFVNIFFRYLLTFIYLLIHLELPVCYKLSDLLYRLDQPCYLKIIPRVALDMRCNYQRGAQRRVGYNHLISNKRESNNCFIENVHKISRILHYFICKTTDFQLVFNFEQTRTVIIFREHGIMAHIP